MFSRILLITIAYLLSSGSAMPIKKSSGNITATSGLFTPTFNGEGYFNKFSSDPEHWDAMTFSSEINFNDLNTVLIDFNLEFRDQGLADKHLPTFAVFGTIYNNVYADPQVAPDSKEQILSLSNYEGSFFQGLAKSKPWLHKHILFQGNDKGDASITIGGDLVKNPYVKWDINDKAVAKSAALINPKTGAKQSVDISFSASTQYTVIPEKYVQEAEAAGFQNEASTTPYLCMSSENGTPLCLGYSDICKKDPKVQTPNVPSDTTCKHYFVPGKTDEVILGNDLWRFFDVSIDYESNVAAFEPKAYKYADFKIGQQ